MNVFKSASKALKVNKLRSFLTISVVIVGISSVVGIQSALSIITEKVSESFGKMGASSFSIQAKKDKPPLAYSQVMTFKSQYTSNASVSIMNECTLNGVITHKDKSTDPVITVIASDEDFLRYQMGEIEKGRMLEVSDVDNSNRVAVIGYNVQKRLFGNSQPTGEEIIICGIRFEIVGVLKRQGSLLGMGLDNMVVLPATTARNTSLSSGSYSIAIVPEKNYDNCFNDAERLMMSIRRTQEPDFEISGSDSVQNKLSSVSEKLSVAALIIGLIAMFGAAISLMNIMLVSVNERKMEIGVKKALGASKAMISIEFLSESVLIGIYGVVLGIGVGLLFGKLSAFLLEAEMIIPVKWIAISVVISFLVSIMSGWIPARQAAAVDPVESLRKER